MLKEELAALVEMMKRKAFALHEEHGWRRVNEERIAMQFVDGKSA